MKTGKIENFNLGPRISKLHFEDGKTTAQIAKILSGEGFELSQPTVARFIKKVREANKDEVGAQIRNYMTEHIPDDLEALEKMEEKCLNWMNEEPDTKVERLGLWQKVRARFAEWRDRITSGDPEKIQETMSPIITQCLNWILEDINIQKERIAAMRMATSIIDTKLKYSVVLAAERPGSIYIGPAEPGDETSGEKQEEDYRLHLVGKEDNDRQ